MDREERRRRTRVVAARRRADHLRIVHRGDAADVACLCELADCYFQKRRALGCGCRKRKKGAPRGPGGASPLRYDALGGVDGFGRSVGTWQEVGFRSWHKVGERDRIYKARHQWRTWWKGAAAGRMDPADDPAPPRGG